jgi:hypothetical protein
MASPTKAVAKLDLLRDTGLIHVTACLSSSEGSDGHYKRRENYAILTSSARIIFLVWSVLQEHQPKTGSACDSLERWYIVDRSSWISYVIFPDRGIQAGIGNPPHFPNSFPSLSGRLGHHGEGRLIGFGDSLVETCRSTSDGWLINRGKPPAGRTWQPNRMPTATLTRHGRCGRCAGGRVIR